MVSLLRNTSIFQPLANGCYFQLTGLPVTIKNIGINALKRPREDEDRSSKRSKREYGFSTSTEVPKQKIRVPYVFTSRP